MIEPTSEVVIRMPLPLRIYVVLFLVVWCALLGWGTFVASHGPPIVVGVLFIAWGLFVGSMILRNGVVATRDGRLRVQNYWKTRTYTRADIEDFRPSTVGGSRFGSQSIALLLRDGSVYNLVVTRGNPFSRRTNDQRLTALRAWLRR